MIFASTSSDMNDCPPLEETIKSGQGILVRRTDFKTEIIVRLMSFLSDVIIVFFFFFID